MDYEPITPPHPEKRIAIIIAILIVSAVIGYFGYQRVMEWHKQELQAAVAEQQRIMAEKNADLEDQIAALKNKLAMVEPPPVSNKRLSEVFGSPAAKPSPTPDLSCDALKKKISSFFNYLQKNDYTRGPASEKNPAEVFDSMVRALAANPPMITDETRDMVSFKHNLAHFYRIFNKDRFEMVKKILTAENDVLEHAMADFYAYYSCDDCCQKDANACISLNTLYGYSAFFLHTFAGRSYLFRRNPAVRCLTDYYAVLILDKANDAGINRYGIDIRPHIKLALNDITSQNDLEFQDRYIKTLTALETKYGDDPGA